MGTISVKAPSTQGIRSHLIRAQPRAGTIDQGRFTPHPRVTSSNGRTFDSPEAQLRQASRRSNLGQIASPADRIAGAFNARVAWHLILTRALQSTWPKWPQSLCPSADWLDRKTAPPALLRLLCHLPGWGWKQPSLASGAIGISASPDPRARTRPRSRRQSPPRPTPGLGLDLASDDDLRLARPHGSDSTSLQKTVSASLDPRARTWPRLGRRSPPRPTPGLGLNLNSGRRSLPRSTPGLGLNLDLEDGLRLARPQGSDSTSTSEDDLRLAQPPGPGSASTSEEPPPRPTSGSDWPCHKGGHHYPT
jgi:hypothetical protein